MTTCTLAKVRFDLYETQVGECSGTPSVSSIPDLFYDIDRDWLRD